MKAGALTSILFIAGLAPAATALEPRAGVVLRALDKITGNSTDLRTSVGSTIEFGRLELTVRACFQAPPEDTPESAAFIEVQSNTPEERARLPGGQDVDTASQTGANADGQIFSGWMFASSPGLNALDHPTYDVWVITCTASAP